MISRCFDALIFRIINKSASRGWKYSTELIPMHQLHGVSLGVTWAFSCGPYSSSEEPEASVSEELGQAAGRKGGVTGFSRLNLVAPNPVLWAGSVITPKATQLGLGHMSDFESFL